MVTSRQAVEFHLQKPVVENLTRVVDFTLDKVRPAMVRLGISPDEVLSAVAKPDRTEVGANGTMMHFRGDVRAWVDHGTRDVLEIADLNAKVRAEPRKPLERLPYMTPVKKARAAKSTESAQRVRVPETEEALWVFGKHKTPDVRFVNVTPVIAGALLERNVGYNRPARTADAEDWADQMIDGRWKITHQGVALDTNGKLVDGQHRLEAITLSESTARMVVVVGLDPSVYEVIDTGRSRTFADTLASRGFNNVFALSAVIKMLWQYEQGVLTQRHRSGRRPKVHNDALVAYFLDREEEIQEAVSRGNRCGTAFFARKSAVAVGCYLIRDHERADEFLETMIDGSGLGKHDARFAFRRYCLNQAGVGAGSVKVRSHVVLAVFLKAWAAFLDDRQVRVLAFRLDEDFPGVAGIEQPQLSE